MQVFIVDAFTSERFKGNRAGVVVEAEALTAEEKQQIASEINASETAFVVQRDPEYFKVEYFTPTTEIDFCGHATVGTFHTLASMGKILLDGGMKKIVVETRAGVFPVEVTRLKDEILVAMTHSSFNIAPLECDPDGVAESLGLSSNSLDREFSILFSKTANWHLMVGVKDRVELDRLSYDVDKLSEILLQGSAVTAHVFCKGEGPGKFHARNFCPTVGIPEDPGTGSAAAAFGAYLAHTGHLTADTNEFCIVQGEKMGRRSEIGVTVHLRGGQFEDVKFSGTAVPSFQLIEHDLVNRQMSSSSA